jgi:hypothetical protein
MEMEKYEVRLLLRHYWKQKTNSSIISQSDSELSEFEKVFLVAYTSIVSYKKMGIICQRGLRKQHIS